VSDWPFVATARLASMGVLRIEDGNHGEYRPRPEEFVDTGVAFIRAADMSAGAVDFNASAKINQTAMGRITRGKGLPHDVLLSHKGTVGKVAIAPWDAPDFVCSPQTTFWRSLDLEWLDPRFLAYYLRSPEFVLQLESRKGETDMAAYVSLTEQRRLMIRLPPVHVQRGIAYRLRGLDDKIQANLRLLRCVISLVKAEVHAAVLVAGSRAVPITALARFVNGGAFTKGATGSGRMVIRIAELNSGPGGSTVYTELDVPQDKTARPGDLLMSWSGSLDVYRWTREEAIINQHIFKVIPDVLPAWLVHERLKAVMPIFQSIAKDKATTMGHIQRGHLESTMVMLPPWEQVRLLDARLGPLWDRLLLAEREIHSLTALRDALLPELLSGRIRVPDADEVVESAMA